MTTPSINSNLADKWEQAPPPSVNAVAEFHEIIHDFGNPLELLREAISNSIDWRATWIKISFSVEPYEGNNRLFIRIEDDGIGMKRAVLATDFWGLGFSQSRELKSKGEPVIGEKGHGTKIYLRSEKVIVRTQGSEGAFEAECDRPLSALAQQKLHQPRIRAIEPFLERKSGTQITIIGYNSDQRAKYIGRVVKDYLLWFTKAGSIERAFDVHTHKDFKVILKTLDTEEEEIPFGHFFPEEDSDIEKLFEQKEGPAAADWYVKRYTEKGLRLEKHPEVTFDIVVSVEGDAVKRDYNKMIRDRRRADTGRYRVSDRYGVWICKDYIPITRVNEWISGFGTGSNSIVLLHGFVNCQALKLTANRGDVANTDVSILEELQSAVAAFVNRIDLDLRKDGLFTLLEWQQEEVTLQQERTEFDRRVKNLKGRRTAKLDGRLLVEPQNESELFGIFVAVYTLHPELFEFEPLDYNTSRGIDVIARNKSGNPITEGDHSYVELKHTLQAKRFNHAYQHLRWILCWDFAPNIIVGTSDFSGVEENDIRRIQAAIDDDGKSIYFLDSKKKATKIQIIRLKEFLKERLGLEFLTEK